MTDGSTRYYGSNKVLRRQSLGASDAPTDLPLPGAGLRTHCTCCTVIWGGGAIKLVYSLRSKPQPVGLYSIETDTLSIFYRDGYSV